MTEFESVASVGLIAIGTLCLTVLSDVVTGGGLALGLALGGGLGLLIGGVWQWRVMPARGMVDERFLQIGFRSAAITCWTLLVGVMALSNAERAAGFAYPVFGPYTWLVLAGVAVFLASWAWYSRVM